MDQVRRHRVLGGAGGRPRRVVAVAYDRVGLFELAIAAEVFGLPRPELGAPLYEFAVCSPEPGSLRATGSIQLHVRRGLRLLGRADTVLIPGWRDPREEPPAGLVAAVRTAHARGARLVSICSGVFVLAATGLLDGRRATTHWRYADDLRERYPSIRVEADALYVDEERIFTSAGSAAGIDLCLHLVRLDHGAEIANLVARRLVVPPHRDGGQAQYVASPVPNEPGGGLARALDWALARLDQPMGVDDLARAAAVSPRTLLRRFQAELGTSPHAWLTLQRVLAAQRLLETRRDTIEEVAAMVGFGTSQTLRHHFRRLLRHSPTAYRRRFFTRSATGPAAGQTPAHAVRGDSPPAASGVKAHPNTRRIHAQPR